MKKSFTLLELIFVIKILIVLYKFFIPNQKINKLNEVINRLDLYISHIRYQALIDDKFSNDTLWHKKRWTLKFFRCRESVGGIYYSIYSDENLSGHPNASESFKDPLTNKNIYSSNLCNETNNNSKYVLLSKNFGIKDVKISCNSTTSLGQISFGKDGRVYSRLSNIDNESFEYEIIKSCSIKFIDENDNFKELIINPKTGYSTKGVKNPIEIE
jgi:type II secretory pathway pseudopilin PulG